MNEKAKSQGSDPAALIGRRFFRLGRLFRCMLVLSLGLIVLTVILPQFTELYEGAGAPLPLVTKILLWTRLLQDFTYIPLIVVILALLFLGAWLDGLGQRWIGKFWWDAFMGAAWLMVVGVVVFVVISLYLPLFKIGEVIR